MTAYIAGVTDIGMVDGWLAGDAINGDEAERFCLALRVVNIVLEQDPPEIVQAWLIGLNPELGDRVRSAC